MFDKIINTAHYYYDKIEHHLPFKPSKWDRKYKIALLALGAVFLIMAIVAFALHDQVPPFPQLYANPRLSTFWPRMRSRLRNILARGLFRSFS